MGFLITPIWCFTGFLVLTGLVLTTMPAIGQRVAAFLVPFFEKLASAFKPAQWIAADGQHFAIAAIAIGTVLMAASSAITLLPAQGVTFILVASTTLFVFVYGVIILTIAAAKLFLATPLNDNVKVCDAGVKFICTGIIFAGWAAALTINSV
ncbi:hypothetical protein [Pelagibius sp. Alg239-R121]|uniref:hypothetical protein n=1 Tax=Pelagibius sp. Alg239-R121 TaxID=2993448 RepID=UPI0024A75E45|nr:hypothetical protein [Pelagibius sp. Alg239-R121]